MSVRARYPGQPYVEAEAEAAGIPTITTVYRFRNGMICTFDQFGQQMPEYNGAEEDVLATIRAHAPHVPITEQVVR